MNNEIETSVRGVFAKILAVEPTKLTADSRRGELEGWDSMAHLDLVAELEMKFSMQIDADDALGIETFGDAVRLITERTNNA